MMTTCVFIRLTGPLALLASVMAASAGSAAVVDSSPLRDQAAYFQWDLLDKHWLDGNAPSPG